MEYSDRESSAKVLSEWVRDARAASLELIADLDDQQLRVPMLPTINPLLWEIGHAAWFQEHWVLQHAARHKPIRPDGAQVFDSISIPHHVRWDLPLPSRNEILRYVCQVSDQVSELLDRGRLMKSLVYFIKLSVFHEDMHTEAFTYTRQTLGYRPPTFLDSASRGTSRPLAATTTAKGNGKRRDIEIHGGDSQLGAPRDAAFAFDNEKWAHAVHVKPFAIAQTAVTQEEFAAFVNENGYGRSEFWNDDGWRWRKETGAEHPVYWRREGTDAWFRRHFDQWLPLEPDLPVIHVNWFEADAYCRWAGRRLPSEAEWELAAGGAEKRHYPWGEEPPCEAKAQLDWQSMNTTDVTAHPTGDSPDGLRQMIGNVWEWTASTLNPYPGFVADPYKDYSEPWFHTRKVLRGGCWATRSRMLRGTWRNFYEPHRRDVFAGFRTCAVTG